MSNNLLILVNPIFFLDTIKELIFIFGLFHISFFGILVIRRDFITVLIATELIFLTSILLLLISSRVYNAPVCEIFTIFILVVAAAETSLILIISTVFKTLK